MVSTWGNDLTLHAPSTGKMSALTRRTLQRADALITDVRRDANLAAEWGFDSSKPTLIVPGNGGLNLDEISSVIKGIGKAEPPRIINPRGLRSYVRNDTFFKAIPLVLRERPDVHFVCTSMAEQPEALRWVEKLGIEKNVTLLPTLSQHELWREFAKSQISVSVSTHDGTPNTLLEAMAIGCFPICGNIDSIREWIINKENGLLVNPADEKELAKSILTALSEHSLVKAAVVKNQTMVKEKVELSSVRKMVTEFLCMVR